MVSLLLVVGGYRARITNVYYITRRWHDIIWLPPTYDFSWDIRGLSLHLSSLSAAADVKGAASVNDLYLYCLLSSTFAFLYWVWFELATTYCVLFVSIIIFTDARCSLMQDNVLFFCVVLLNFAKGFLLILHFTINPLQLALSHFQR